MLAAHIFIIVRVARVALITPLIFSMAIKTLIAAGH